MPTTTLPSRTAIRQHLNGRIAMLRELLDAATPADGTRDVQDFKDVAVEQSQATVAEVKSLHAAEEIAQLGDALRRLDDGSYGTCEDCGEAIDPRRLEALPATRYCTACQAVHERHA
jgi:RNA polymerase-binding transcription factor DksA